MNLEKAQFDQLNDKFIYYRLNQDRNEFVS